MYSGKNGLSKPSYNPFLPTQGTLTDPIACAQQRHRQKVPNDKRDDPAAWEPKKVPRELQKILPNESYNKDKKKYQAAYELQLHRHVASILQRCREWTDKEKRRNAAYLGISHLK